MIEIGASSDESSARCRPMKQRDRKYRKILSNPTFDRVLFAVFGAKYREILLSCISLDAASWCVALVWRASSVDLAPLHNVAALLWLFVFVSS